MRYNGYDEYDRYGRRGRYRGNDYIEDMREHYMNYNESRDAYNRGSYGAENDKMKSLDYMLKSAEKFFEMLKDEAESPEERKFIEKTVRKIGDM